MAKYKRDFNKPTPNFQNNKNDNPTTVKSVLIGFLALIPVYSLLVGILTLLVLWGVNDNKSLGYFSIALLLLYLIIFPIICNLKASLNCIQERKNIKDKIH